jgi:hypothetical protein
MAGVMFSELADSLDAPEHRLALYVAHDTSVVRLAAGLGIFPLRWPRLGSEIVIEVSTRTLATDNRTDIIKVWNDKHRKQFVRVLYDGEVISSLSWTPLGDFISLLKKQVPDHLFEKCTTVSGKTEDMKRLDVPFTVQ